MKPSESAQLAELAARLEALAEGREAAPLPLDTQAAPEVQALVTATNRVLSNFGVLGQFATSLARGELEFEAPARLNVLAPLKALQASLRHLTWQAQEVAAGNLTHRVDFLGEFSTAFNHMIEALREKQRQQAALQASHQEIEERKRIEQELRRTQGELLDASRRAGMAEVTSAVLHNIGNVLNSVNVSASLAAERCRQSRISDIALIAGLLQDHAADLGQFLTEDPKGCQLPAYLAKLAPHLAQERRLILDELASLRSNIEHIETIVKTQQSYARMSGVVEATNPAQLVEDALRINVNMLERCQVQVIRQYDPRQLPEAPLDKHKVLQILINLIRNAAYACQESGRPDRCLTLRIGQEKRRIQISVNDNGVGIPPENLTRIFTHGFTTRRDGHGFGLHSGALAAREMGGALQAASEGVGKGATFSLELPLAPASTACESRAA